MLVTKRFDNSEDYLDTRDMDEAIQELEDAVKTEHHSEADEREILILKAFRQEIIDSFGETCFEDGITLVRDSYFAEYAEELARDIGAIGRDYQWPQTYIDWDAAADALKADYSSVSFDEVEYWGRE